MMPERLAELLAVRAVADLSPDEARELEALLRQHPEVDEHDYELALASLQLEPLPADLRERLLRQALREPQPKIAWWWWAAAGALAAAFVLAARA